MRYEHMLNRYNNDCLREIHRTTLVHKEGGLLVARIPFDIVPEDEDLKLVMWNRSHRLAEVSAGVLNGLEVVSVGDQLAVRFRYLNPKTGQLEATPRDVVPWGIYFGVHPNHLGEEQDFYLAGHDLQYPQAEGERHFPFWRMGIYGDITDQRHRIG